MSDSTPTGLALDAMLLMLDTQQAGGAPESAVSAAIASYDDVLEQLTAACAVGAARVATSHPGSAADAGREAGEYVLAATTAEMGRLLQGALEVGAQLLGELAQRTGTDPGGIARRTRTDLES